MFHLSQRVRVKDPGLDPDKGYHTVNGRRWKWDRIKCKTVGREGSVVALLGDIITVKIDGVPWKFLPEWLEAVDDPPPAVCTCPITTLMAFGCQCGQMARERG